MKTPTVLQMEAVECGAAALAIILGHFGRAVSLEQMRVECGVSRDGSKASNILRAARRFGLIASGYKKEPMELPELGFPVVVFWNFNHFLVVEDFGKKRVYLNDPACGRRTVSFEEFDQSFTGVVLTFKTGPTFERGGERRSVYRSLRSRLPGTRLALAYVTLAGVALALPALATPAFNKIFVDAYLIGGNFGRSLTINKLRPLLLIMAATVVLRSLLTWLQQKVLLRLENKLAIANASKFFWHVMRLPVEFFSQRYAGEVGSRVEINDTVAMLISGDLATNLIHLFTAGLYAALMFLYDPWLAWIAISIAALNLAVLKLVSRRRADASQKLLQERGKLQGVCMSGLQTIESLKATGSESDFFRRWSGHQAKVLNSQQKLGISSQALIAVPGLLAALGAAAVLSLGGLRVMNSFLTLGMLVAFQGLFENFSQPVENLTALGGKLQELHGDMRRLDDVLYHPIDVLCHPIDSQLACRPETTIRKLSGGLELRNITFGYNRLEAPLLRSFNLRLRPGARVALVGGSGSGKSTVAKLVCGLYQPWDGAILLDGIERSRIPRNGITASVAMVDQEVFLFEGTVRENLTMWDTTVPEDEIIAAAKDACIHDDIMQRPGGYDHRVEEGGRNFSGGQCQRLEIARALIGNPSLLVLDEATSALDPAVEKAVEDNLRRRGCTCLIVAHRLSAIRDCEEIVVLERGETVERGSHAELNSTAGRYASLIRAA